MSEAVSGVLVIEVDKEFTEEGGEEDFDVDAAGVPKAGVGGVDGVWGVNSRDMEVLPECGEDHGVHFEGRGERQLGY